MKRLCKDMVLGIHRCNNYNHQSPSDIRSKDAMHACKREKNEREREREREDRGREEERGGGRPGQTEEKEKTCAKHVPGLYMYRKSEGEL